MCECVCVPGKTFQSLSPFLLYSPPAASSHIFPEQAEIGSVFHVSGGTGAVCSDNRLVRPTSLPCGSRHSGWMDGTRRGKTGGADEKTKQKQGEASWLIIHWNGLLHFYFFIIWRDNFTAVSVKVSSHLRDLYDLHRSHQVLQLDSLCQVQTNVTHKPSLFASTTVPPEFLTANLEISQLQPTECRAVLASVLQISICD